MKFNPNIHDKAFCLKRPALVSDWMQSCPVFQQSKLAQDYDVLALNEGIGAASLALNCPGWGVSPASQNKKVLKLFNGTVAHVLSEKHSGWAKTPAAQKEDVLNLLSGQVRRNLIRHSPAWRHTAAGQEHFGVSQAASNAAFEQSNVSTPR